MPDQNQSGGANLNSDGDTNVGGDVVGRDKNITATTTSTTTINEGGPTARYAVIGLVVVAALTIIVIAVIAFGGNHPPAPSPTLSATPTLEAPSRTLAPIPATTEPPSPTPTFTFTPSPTPTTETPTPTDTDFPTAIPTLTPAPSPTSALAVYDTFDDRCLDDALWTVKPEGVGPETPTPTAFLLRVNCLDTQLQFLTEDENGHLAVFLTLEGDETANLIQKSNACYQQVEVALNLFDVIVLGDSPGTDYLSVGVSLSRVSGPSFLEVRLQGSNVTGRLTSQINARLTAPTGPGNFGPWPYAFNQPVTIAFRVKNNRLTLYLDDQPLLPSFSILPGSTLCGLTLGYHADNQTLLDGYFDEVRLTPLP
jgi:hypothetical protein